MKRLCLLLLILCLCVPAQAAELPFLREDEARLCDVCLFYAQAPQDMGWELLSEDGGYWYFACCFYPQGTPTPPPVAASASPPTPSPDIA